MTDQEREPDRAEHARHDEQHAQPAATGLALDLDAAFTDARIDPRRPRRARASSGGRRVVVIAASSDEPAKPTSCNSGTSRTPVAASTRSWTRSDEREHVVGAGAGLGAKKLACFSDTTDSADPQTLQPARVDEPAGACRRAGS